MVKFQHESVTKNLDNFGKVWISTECVCIELKAVQPKTVNVAFTFPLFSCPVPGWILVNRSTGLVVASSFLWSRKWQPTPVFLPGKFHVQRSLAGYSPWGCKELDMTEWLHSLNRKVRKSSTHKYIKTSNCEKNTNAGYYKCIWN